MMGCLPGRRTLWAGLALATLAGAAGCVKDESLFLLDPEGPPAVVAAFVSVEAPPDYEVVEVYAPLYDGVALTFGKHPDINGGVAVTAAASEVTLDSNIRVLFKELLRPSTLEQFKCACWNPDEDGVLAADDTGCTGTVLFSDSPDVNACTGCPDDATTDQDEANHCEDVTQDGTPDDSVLKAGIATVSCDNAAFDLYTNTEDDGEYNPSGSLVIPAALGIDGMGPRFTFVPPFHYPSQANCTLKVNANSTIVDKDGNALPPTDIPFQTTITYIAGTTVRNAAVNVAGAAPAMGPRVFTITFNGDVDKGVANLARVSLACTPAGGGTPVTTNKGASNAIVIETTGGYGTSKTCTLTIAAGLLDAWGHEVDVDLQSAAGAQRTLSFTTSAM